MKKKIIALFLAAVCSMPLIACKTATEEVMNSEVATEMSTEETVEVSTEATTVTESMDESTVEEVPSSEVERVDYETPADMSDDMWSFQLAINGELYQFPMWYSEFEAKGWTYKGDKTTKLASDQYLIREEWTKDGITVFTSIANLSMNTKDVTESAVSAIDVEDDSLNELGWKVEMPGGIIFGVSTEEDVVAAYGKPDGSHEANWGSSVSYAQGWSENIGFCFDKETGVITKISLENIVEMEGLDNSINPEVPDIVKEYVAPTELGKDLYSFDVKIDENYYNFPCPVSEFLKNGYSLYESKGDSELGASDIGNVVFMYKGEGYKYQAANYADYATTIDNCFIYNFDVSDFE